MQRRFLLVGLLGVGCSGSDDTNTDAGSTAADTGATTATGSGSGSGGSGDGAEGSSTGEVDCGALLSTYLAALPVQCTVDADCVLSQDFQDNCACPVSINATADVSEAADAYQAWLDAPGCGPIGCGSPCPVLARCVEDLDKGTLSCGGL